MRFAPLGHLAEINPSGPMLGEISAGQMLDFVPMASVFESGEMELREQRPFSELAKGFTPFRQGDVLIAKITPCFENNKIALARVDTQYAFGSTEFHVVRCRSELLLSRYFLHFIRQDRIRAAGEQRMTGSAGQRRVPKQFLAELSVPIPELPEQKRITAILDQADELRRQRKQARELLNKLPQAIFHEMFGDPVANTKRWKLAALGEVGELDRGVSKHRPRNHPSLLGGPYPLIQTGEVANCDGYITSYAATYSEAGLRQSRLWGKGTLCITIAANIGKSGILDFDACFPDSVVGFAPGQAVRTEYVHCWMTIIQSRLEEAAPQVAQKNINLAILRELPLPVPPLALQDQFVQRIRRAYTLKTLHDAHLCKLDALFSSLQHHAFKGELTSKMVERELEMAS